MKQNSIRLSLNLFLFVSIAFFNTQLIPFLKSVGYSSFERNILLAINALLAIVLQMMFGYVCDRFKGMKKFFLLGYLLFLFFGIWMFIQTQKAFYVHLITTSMMAAMAKVLTGLIETWMLYLDEKKYGIYRAIGAFGLCIASPIAGIIIDKFSYQGIIYSSIAVCIVVCILIFGCDEMQYEKQIDYKKLLQLFKNKKYMYMVCIYMLIYLVGSGDQYIVVDKMLKLKASSFLIGVKWAIQSLMEIPFFLFATKILKKYDAYTLLKFGIVMYGIKFALYGFSSSVYMIIFTTMLQLVTLPIIAYTSKIIFAEIEPSLKASSQMIAMALFIGGSAFLTPLITSFLLPKLGYDLTLYSFALLTIFPFLLLQFKKRILP